MYSRNKHNIVKKLSFNKKKKGPILKRRKLTCRGKGRRGSLVVQLLTNQLRHEAASTKLTAVEVVRSVESLDLF